jgi:hypothetical protein
MVSEASLSEDLVTIIPESIWDVSGRRGKGNTATVKSIRIAISVKVATYAMSDERAARKNALDNEQ